MRVVEQTHQIVDRNGVELCHLNLERCGRIAYSSASKIKDGSAKTFLKNIIARGHESVLEHYSFTVIFVTDRSVTHELVRHRLASFTQESQRYVRYSDGVDFISPFGSLEATNPEAYVLWLESVRKSEVMYGTLLNAGEKPEIARAVLPNCTATKIAVTANVREWRHILKLRCDKSAHPQIRALMRGLLDDLKQLTFLFDDIEGDE